MQVLKASTLKCELQTSRQCFVFLNDIHDIMIPLVLPACNYGYYKAEAGAGQCEQCPERSYTTSEASNSRQQCICEADTHGTPGGPCQAVQCTEPTDPEHGRVLTEECGTNNNDRCSFSCDAGYVLQGSRTRTCTANGWNGHPPVCVGEYAKHR